MSNTKDIIYIKGKESFIVSIFTLLATIIFFAPIVLILILKLSYSVIKKIRNNVLLITQLESHSLEKILR
ncbi:MAG: hypothetical protein JXR51_10675 [Bacteroidales bacterium]|nr:hypothetical protein [Bacteroidales bacterium]MBN2757631.1 hypothetical protein [Bacteroidales bacterium]